MLAAGTLRHRITIEEPIETRGASGSVEKTWQEIPNGRAWAARNDLDGRELFQAQQTDARVTTRFVIRYRTDVDARMRVVSGDVPYLIESVQDPEGRREFLLLLCSRSAN